MKVTKTGDTIIAEMNASRSTICIAGITNDDDDSWTQEEHMQHDDKSGLTWLGRLCLRLTSYE